MRSSLIGRLREGARNASSLARVVARARRAYGAGYAGPALRALRLARRRGFSHREAYELGLLDPDRAGAAAAAVASKREATALQDALNPPRWQLLVQDKGLFHRYCARTGLPTPRLLALYFRAATGWSPDHGTIRGEAEWTAFLRRLPEECVLKPSLGYHGRAIRILARSDGRFVDQGGAALSAAQLYRLLADDREFDAFVIQERLRNDPAIAKLAGTDRLQTVRAMTLVDGEGRPRLLKAVLRVIVGRNATDNYRGGRSGNLVVPVDPGEGTLDHAATVDPWKPGVRWVDRHPDTGVPFRGVALPGWEEVLTLVLEAAEAFLPLRTVGWDVAVTPTGPVLLEGNGWWDPLNPVGGWGRVLVALREEAGEIAPDLGPGTRRWRTSS